MHLSQVHQPSKKCTNRADVPSVLFVQQRQLHPLVGGVGMAGMPYPPNLCASVSICGRLSLPEGSVCSAYSVGHSLCLLCWCCRGSCTSVVVFSHRIHGIHGMLGCVIGGVGMAGMPYPPNLCASVSICGRLSLPEGSVCSAYSVGHSLCLLCWCCRGSCTSVVVFSHRIHGIHGMLGCVIGGVGMAGMPYPPNLCASVSICGRLSLPEGSVCSAYSVGPLSPFACL